MIQTVKQSNTRLPPWPLSQPDKVAVSHGCWFDLKAAERVRRFFKNILRHSKGEFAGQPFELLDWQWEQFIGPLFGWKRPNGLRRFNRVYMEIGKKNGKALAIDTPIPTPDGWKQMGDLRPGDMVFGEDGKPCRIVAATETMFDRPCYEVLFCDGCRIVADKDHLWKTMTRKPEGKQRLWTTEQLSQNLFLDFKGSEGWNHSISVAGAVECPEDENLPIDPYVLGIWLGNGTSANANITVGHKDLSQLMEIRRAGYATNVIGTKKGNASTFNIGGYGRGPLRKFSLCAILNRIGLRNNKHIPAQYLRASIAQRWRLFQGLMDTDGYAGVGGQLEFTTTTPALRDGFMALAISLGLKPKLREGRATIYGKDCGPKYRINTCVFNDQPAFLLPRKFARQKPRPDRKPRSTTRHIVGVNKIASVPVRCIQVDNPSGMFLAGTSMIPTHNSAICSALSLYMLVADSEPGSEVYCAANDREQAGIVFNEARNMVQASPDLDRKLEIIDSTKRIILPETKSILRALSNESKTKDGINAHLVIFDELHQQQNRDMWDVLAYAGAARRQPLQVAVTTAGYDKHSICYEQHDYAVKVLDGTIIDDTFLPLIFAASPEDDWKLESTWKKANPSYGVTLRADAIARDCHEAIESPAKENAFRRFHLCQWTEQDTRWLSMAKWKEAKADYREDDLLGKPCYAGLDLASTTDIAAFAMVFPGDAGSFKLLCKFWVPEEGARKRAKKDRVPYPAWIKDGFITGTPGDIIDYDVIFRDIMALSKKFQIKEVAFDRWGATQLCANLDGEGLEMVTFGQGFSSMSSPTKQFEALLLSGKLNHNNNPVLNWMASNVTVATDSAGNLKPCKNKSQEKIDGIVASIMGLGRAMLKPQDSNKCAYDYHGVQYV